VNHDEKDAVDLMIERWHEDGELSDPVALATFTRMARIVRAINEHKERTVESLGVPMWVISTTYALRRRGRPYAAGPTDLAAELGVTQAAMTSRVRRLLERGWVAASPDPDDGRRVVVRLTAKGHRLTEHVSTLQAGVETSHLAALTPHQRANLDVGLRKLLAAIQLAADPSGRPW
jgi:DNA-binding MarR family transcriptional regulator